MTTISKIFDDESEMSWGDYDLPEETTQSIADRIVSDLAKLDREERYKDMLIERLVDKIDTVVDGIRDEVLEKAVRKIFAHGLVTPPFDPYDLPTVEEEILDGWIVPDLTDRKAIWRNFPVSVKVRELGCADGKDRYAIVWHAENFDAWRAERSESNEEYQDYESWVRTRLEHALGRYSHIYTVEQSEDAIYVIAVDAEEQELPQQRALDVLRAAQVNWKRDGANHDVVIPRGMTEDAQAKLLATLRVCSDCTVVERAGFLCRVVIGDAAPAAAPVVAPVARPLDVLRRFPVTWDRNGAVHDIKVHFGKCPRKEIPTMTANLLAAMRACTGCTVSAAVSDAYICRVVIN
jgi:hypothetical protein